MTYSTLSFPPFSEFFNAKFFHFVFSHSEACFFSVFYFDAHKLSTNYNMHAMIQVHTSGANIEISIDKQAAHAVAAAVITACASDTTITHRHHRHCTAQYLCYYFAPCSFVIHANWFTMLKLVEKYWIQHAINLKVLRFHLCLCFINGYTLYSHPQLAAFHPPQPQPLPLRPQLSRKFISEIRWNTIAIFHCIWLNGCI